jgi:two-component system sensor kinase FixL
MSAADLASSELRAVFDAAVDAALVRERDRTSRYLAAIQTMLVALDMQRRVTLVNRKGCEVLGRAEEALVGVDWFDTVVRAEDRAIAVEEFAALLMRGSSEPFHTEYRIRAADGSDRLFAWRHVLVRQPDGGATGILCSGEDVTSARRAEMEARYAREQMMHVSRLATVGEMAAGISHELNQPLAAITTYAQAARRLLAAPDFGTEDVSDALEQIAAQALRAGEIIRRLRSLVRNRSMQREPTQINALIEELGALARADARMPGVRVRLVLAAALPELDLDPIQIQQVLINLVRNAVEALEQQESASRELLIKTALDDGGDVEIQVCDTGSGVSQDMLARLFMPFATTKRDGTGLGLAISRGIIEAHKGTLEYVPNVPRGSCFVIRLPLREGSSP